MPKINYREGDWFAIPLRERDCAVGVVARANPRAALLGYFFGSNRRQIPTLDDVRDLRPADAVLVGRFGHLGLMHGKWPILGQLASWDRSEWPMPVFVRHEELTGQSFKVIYDDDDPGRLLREERIPAGQAARGPKDGLMGAGFVEKALAAAMR